MGKKFFTAKFRCFLYNVNEKCLKTFIVHSRYGLECIGHKLVKFQSDVVILRTVLISVSMRGREFGETASNASRFAETKNIFTLCALGRSIIFRKDFHLRS